jgi:voltage-gated potassium channel
VTASQFKSLITVFFKRKAVRRVAYGFAAIQVVIAYGVAGYLSMGWSFVDALYQVVITVSGVGFNEVEPMLSTGSRVFTMSVIGLGMLSVAFTLGSFVQFLTETEIIDYFGRHRMMKNIETLTGHIIVAGYGHLGGLICDELAAREKEFVLIDSSRDRVATAEARDFLVIVGDATEEHVLEQAGIARAKVLVTVTPNDTENVFITLTARQMCPSLVIVSRAEGPSTPKKLRQAGANHVVMPAAIGAHRIVGLLTNPGAVRLAELVTDRTSMEIEMEELLIAPTCTLSGHSLRDADVKRRTGVIVVAIKRADGRLEFPPTGDEIFAPGDHIVLMGRHQSLLQFRQHFQVGGLNPGS